MFLIMRTAHFIFVSDAQKYSMNNFSSLAISRQKFRNFLDKVISLSESHPTVMEAEKDPIYIPSCYQCENRKTEEVYFQMIRADELCSSECLQCASFHDIARASECAKRCSGLPTFCYPIERMFNHRKCYRATFWYGCIYKSTTPDMNLTTNCVECAKTALNLVDAQECAIECNGLPTYNTKTVEHPNIVQCTERQTATADDFFYFEIPPNVVHYMHVSNPGNIYPAQALANSYISPTIGKRVFGKFNMSLLTWPRFPGYVYEKTEQ